MNVDFTVFEKLNAKIQLKMGNLLNNIGIFSVYVIQPLEFGLFKTVSWNISSYIYF